ncbi:hypothetical protein SBA4_30020 [Candidatus Sulfopaludibacter sp. SbA4]|nr:hypothetical protein SBA4_30020 [Candidatus Sulfopaludibacter sp. SbA4]
MGSPGLYPGLFLGSSSASPENNPPFFPIHWAEEYRRKGSAARNQFLSGFPAPGAREQFAFLSHANGGIMWLRGRVRSNTRPRD